MVKYIKGLIIASSLLMLLSACGKAEADLPSTETEVQEEQTQENLENSETSANSETTEIPEDAVMIQDVAVRLLSVEADEL